MDTSKYEQRLGNRNNKSIRNRNSSNKDVRIPTRKQEQHGINENRQIVENKFENIRELDNSSFSFKQKQLDIIKNNNFVNDDYHTWIRNVEDIKTLEETINDSDYIDYDNYNHDLSRQDIENAIDSGKITVYSSYPIKQGVFVLGSCII